MPVLIAVAGMVVMTGMVARFMVVVGGVGFLRHVVMVKM
jgi:hypothetical protein